MSKISLSTKVGNLEFKSPFIAASGTWGYGTEFLDHPVQAFLGAFVTKSLSVYPSDGNSMPRISETDAGMLNSIGLENIGIDSFLSRVEPQLKLMRSPYILSFYGQSIDDFKNLAARAQSSTAFAIELNISCPNIEKGGLEFSSDPRITENLVATVKRELKKPLWVKLSPNVTSILDIALAAEAGGADAVSMINTVVGMSINIESHKPSLGHLVGGLSGPAIKPIAIEKVFRCAKKLKIPIIGIGGIRNARDTVEFLMAGASAVQIGTWNFRDPFNYESLTRDLIDFMKRKGFKTVREMIGIAHQ